MTTITLIEDACAIIKSDERIKVFLGDGTVIDDSTHVALCRCGKSKIYPMCDGSHKKDPKDTNI